MPKDARGNFHPSIQRAMAADKSAMPAPKAKAPRAPMAPPMESGHDEGGAVHEHLKAIHGELGGGKLHLVHHDGINITSHHVGEDGEAQGPHDHANMEALKEHMGRFLDEEGQEPSAEHDMATGRMKDVY